MPLPMPFVPGLDTGTPIDPVTGRPIDTAGLREGAALGAAQIARGFGMDVMQEERRAEALTLLGNASASLLPSLSSFAQQSLDQANNPEQLAELGRLLFAQGSDQASTSALATSRALSSNLGGRGISASSPLAAGLSSQIDLARAGQVRGVERDVRIELLRRAATDRATAFSQALSAQQASAQLAGQQADITMQVPEYGFRAQEGATELAIERAGLEMANKNAKKASKNAKLGSIGSAAVGLAGAVIK